MNQVHSFSFGHLEFLNSYAIITCNEGVNIDFSEIEEIEIVTHQVYKEQRFAMIANRKNHYSVNPFAIRRLFSNEKLFAGAIVGDNNITKANAEYENNFVKEVPIRYFPDMHSAINWIKDMVMVSSNGSNLPKPDNSSYFDKP